MSLRIRPSLLVLSLLSACAGSTAKLDPTESALGNIPGRWENAFVAVFTPNGGLAYYPTLFTVNTLTHTVSATAISESCQL